MEITVTPRIYMLWVERLCFVRRGKVRGRRRKQNDEQTEEVNGTQAKKLVATRPVIGLVSR